MDLPTAFAEFDGSGNGTVNEREFARGLRKISSAVKMSEDEASALFKLMDVAGGGKGYVTIADFVSFIERSADADRRRQDRERGKDGMRGGRKARAKMVKQCRKQARAVAREAARQGIDLAQYFLHYDWRDPPLGYLKRRMFLRGLDLCGFLFSPEEAACITEDFEAAGGSVVNYNKFLRWCYPLAVRVDMAAERLRAYVAEHARERHDSDLSASFEVCTYYTIL